MREKTMNTVHKLAKASHIIAKICNVLVWIALVLVVLLMAVGLFLVPDFALTIEAKGQGQVHVHIEGIDVLSDMDWTEEDGQVDYNQIQYDILSVEVNGSSVDAYAESTQLSNVFTFSMRSLIGPMMIGLISIIAELVVLHFFMALCRRLRYCLTPFTEEIVQLLQKLTYATIPMLILNSMADSMLSSVGTGNFSLGINITLDQVIVVLVMFLLIAVFKYGTWVQNHAAMMMQPPMMYVPAVQAMPEEQPVPEVCEIQDAQDDTEETK